MDEQNFNYQNDQNGQNQQQNDPYGQNQQNPYGQNQQNPYGQNQQNPYGQDQQTSYGQNGNYYQDYTQNQNYQGQYNNGQQMQPPKKANALAIIGLILGILSIPLGCCAWYGLIAGIPGLICSIIGYRQTKSGIGLAGIICSIIGMVISLVILVLGLIGLSMLNNMDQSELDAILNSLEGYGY